MARISFSTLLSLSIAFQFCAVNAAQLQNIRTIALRGQHAPGTIGNVQFYSFSSPILNSDGQVAFVADLDGDGICCGFPGWGMDNKSGIWMGTPESLVLAVRTGDQAAGFPTGTRYSGFAENFAFSSNGQFGFQSALVRPGTFYFDTYGIWAGTIGSMKSAVLVDDPAPGTPSGVNIRDLDTAILLNSVGKTAFTASLIGTGINSSNDEIIYSGNTGSLKVVAREGDPAPGMPNGVNFGFFGSYALSSNGHVAFEAALNDNLSSATSIWSDRFGSTTLVAHVGDHAPGTPQDVKFNGLGGPVFVGPGEVAFNADLAGPGVEATNDSGIWSEASGTLSLVVREGDHAPNTGAADVKFKSIATPVTNSSGGMAFFGTLSGSSVNIHNDNGVWSDASGTLKLIAREGDPAPGVAEGIHFGSIYPIELNNAGQTAFATQLTGSNITGDNDSAIWAEDKVGNLRLVVRTGDSIEVSPGDFRKISYFEYASGRPNDAFNDRGQFTFFARFTDGSKGIFISDAAAAPEPNARLFFVIAVCFALSMRWTRTQYN